MLHSDRVKTLTIHTRKEAIAFFQSFKTKVNNAYEEGTDEAFQSLLVIIKIFYYLYPIPAFIVEINEVGSIPVSTYLEQLLIKTHMLKLGICPVFREWVVTLLVIFKQNIPELRIEDIKELKDYNWQLLQEWNQLSIIQFYGQALSKSVTANDLGLTAVIVQSFRIFLIYEEQHARSIFYEKDDDWKMIVAYLIEGGKTMSDLRRQEIIVCLCSYLCLKQASHCYVAIVVGAIPYLIATLDNHLLSESFGKKIIQFLKYLLLNISEKDVQTIDFSVFESVVSNFASRFDHKHTVSSVRDLISIAQKRTSGLVDHEDKFLILSRLYEQYKREGTRSEQIRQILNMMNLHSHSEKMGVLIGQYYHKLLSTIVFEREEPDIVALVLHLLSSQFKKGAFDVSVAAVILNKIDKVLTSKSKEILSKDNRKILIQFARIIGQLLANREYNDEVIELIQSHHLQEKLSQLSDGQDFAFQRQLMAFQEKMGNRHAEEQKGRYAKVVECLQKQIIDKSRMNLNQLSPGLLEQITFLKDLIERNQSLLSNLHMSEELPEVVSNYITPAHDNGCSSLLNSLQKEEAELLRKECNYECCRLLALILRGKTPNGPKIQQKMIAIASSSEQRQGLYEVVSSYLRNLEHLKEARNSQRHKGNDSNRVQPQQPANMQHFRDKIRSLLAAYYQAQEHFDINLLNLSDPEGLVVIMQELGNLESDQHLTKYLKLVLELAKKETVCVSVYTHLSPNLLAIYKYLLEGTTQLLEANPNILLLDSIFLNMIRYHMNAKFTDQSIEAALNFYADLMMLLHLHLEKSFSQKKILLLQLILEYFELNQLDCEQPKRQLLTQQSRREVMRYFIDLNRGVGLCSIYGELITMQQEVAYDQALWMQHKQNILSNLEQNHQNTSYLKFVSVYLRQCPPEVFKEYQLQDIIQLAIKLLHAQMSDMKVIIHSYQAGALKLREIKYYSLLLQSLNSNHLLRVTKNLLYAQEEVLVKLLINLLYFIESLTDEQLKKKMLQQIVPVVTATLLALYRCNYGKLKVRGQELIEHFPALLQMEGEQVKIGLCQLMRVFLLKKEAMMADCESLRSCKTYLEWLPSEAQEHITACVRIEQLLDEARSLEEEENLYFLRRSDMYKQTIYAEVASNAGRIDKSHDNAKPQSSESSLIIDLQQPLFRQFATEPELSGVAANQEQTSIANDIDEYMTEHKKQQSLHPVKQKSDSLPIDEKNKVPLNQWTDVQLLAQMKDVLSSQGKGLRAIVGNLLPLQTPEYANFLLQIFLRSQQLLKKEGLQPSDLPSMQKKLIQNIPESCIQLDQRFYQVMALNQIGASICLRKRGVGLQGLEILCNKFLGVQGAGKYAEMIAVNTLEIQDFKYLYSCKMYEPVNKKILGGQPNEAEMEAMLKLIAVTCKFGPFKQHYEISDVLVKSLMSESLPVQRMKDLLKALIGLTKDCEKHKKLVEGTALMHFLGNLLQNEQNCREVKMFIYQLMMNLLEGNTNVAIKYSQLFLEEKIVKQLKTRLENKLYEFATFQILLKSLEFLSLSPQSSIRLLKVSFMAICLSISDHAIAEQSYSLIKASVMVISHIIQTMEINFDRVIAELDRDGLIDYLSSIVPVISKAQSTQVYLQICCKTLTVVNMVKKLMGQKMQILRIMTEISKNQDISTPIIQKWIRILFLLLESSRYNFATDIIKFNIFFSAAHYLKNQSILTEVTINMNMRFIRQLSARPDPENLLIKHGFADFAVMNLKLKNLPLNDYLYILDLLTKLQQKHLFPAILCTRIFQAIIRKMEYHWKDDVATKSIALMKLIKKRVEVTVQFGKNMLEFFGNFLTQSNRLPSSEDYKMTREVICLMSYYINFNDEVKVCFKTKIIVDVLKNWLRVARALDYPNMPQAYKLCIYSIYNGQSLFVDTCGIAKDRIGEIQKVCAEGWRCNLYRLDGSFKEAVLKYDTAKQELIGYKWPDGEIKLKYRLPLKDIMMIYSYPNEKEVVFLESNFTRSSNVFQHKADPALCITVLCLCDGNDVRETSVQFQNQDDLKAMTRDLRILISWSCQLQKEEELRVWSSNRKTIYVPL